MRIKSTGDFGKIIDPTEFQRQISIAMQDIVEAVNGNIEFDLNIRSQTASVAFSTPNVDVAVRHSLARIPIGYWVISSSAAANVYNTTSFDENFIYLKSSASAQVKVVIF